METEQTLRTTENSGVIVFAMNSCSVGNSALKNNSEKKDDSSQNDPNPIAKPNIVDPRDISCSAESSMIGGPSSVCSEYVDPEAFKFGNIKIYAEDTGPQFYPVKGNVVTPPIISKNLSEAFSYLPIYGKPKTKANLEQFQNNKIREYVGCDLSDDDFDKLSKYCSPAHLVTGKELTMPTNVPTFGILPIKKKTEINNDGDHLNIIKKYKLRMERDKGGLYVKKLKYRGMRILQLSLEDSYIAKKKSDSKVIKDVPLEPGKDLLFRIRFYRPFFHGKERHNSRHSVFSRDVVAPGCWELQELRDRVVCPNDADLRLDVSPAPHDAPETTSKDLFPSGFMFINNVFYVDESPRCKDISAPIREWARRRGLGDFPKRRMNGVRLDELLVKLGHPEVYVHQGNCEHLFTFSEVRLLGPGEPMNLALYPRHTCVLQNQTVYCTTCAEFGAKWLATGCARVPFDPAFFCDTCLKLYLYTDGRKIGDFNVYSFRGNEINVLKPLG